jgi:hypothetical protein
MRNSKDPDPNRTFIAHHVFSGSTTMVGVCITVITLFHVMKSDVASYADEMISVDALVFILATLCSYTSLRHNNDRRMERLADVLFFLGLFILVIVGFMIVFLNAHRMEHLH